MSQTRTSGVMLRILAGRECHDASTTSRGAVWAKLWLRHQKPTHWSPGGSQFIFTNSQEIMSVALGGGNTMGAGMGHHRGGATRPCGQLPVWCHLASATLGCPRTTALVWGVGCNCSTSRSFRDTSLNTAPITGHWPGPLALGELPHSCHPACSPNTRSFSKHHAR